MTRGWSRSSARWASVVGALALLGCDDTIAPEAGPTGSASNRATALPSPALSTSSIPSAPNSASAASSAATDPSNLDAASFEALLRSLGRQTGGGMQGDMTPAGLVLGKFTPDDALAKLGLREGDTITKLNAHRMSEPEQIIDATVAVMRSGKFDAEVLREGKPLRVLVESPSWVAANPPKAGSATSAAAR